MKTRVEFNATNLLALASIFTVLAIVQSETIELFDSLNRIIRYFDGNNQARTADGMLGIYLCKGRI